MRRSAASVGSLFFFNQPRNTLAVQFSGVRPKYVTHAIDRPKRTPRNRPNNFKNLRRLSVRKRLSSRRLLYSKKGRDCGLRQRLLGSRRRSVNRPNAGPRRRLARVRNNLRMSLRLRKGKRSRLQLSQTLLSQISLRYRLSKRIVLAFDRRAPVAFPDHPSDLIINFFVSIYSSTFTEYSCKKASLNTVVV